MRFRTRLVVAAAAAVIIAVLAASTASYFAARNALVSSVDGTLQSTAQGFLTHGGSVSNLPGQADFEYVTTNGQVVSGGTLPVSTAVKAVASGTTASFFTTTTVSGTDYREFAVSAGIRTVIANSTFGYQRYRTAVALVIALPLTSVDSELSNLGFLLFVVALGGVALALLLAWLVGRTALVPLDSLTDLIEDVAETTDVSRRLDPGGSDELGRLRKAFNHLLAALERSRESQRQLVLDAGHELRTPLTSLRTNMEVVRRIEEVSPEDRAVLVDDVLTQLAELTTLVADLSELARGERAEAPAEPNRFDQLVEDIVEIARTHARTRGVTIDCTTEPAWVNVRRPRVERAFGNLLDNAIKWSPSGATVEVVQAGGSVTVRDHGRGIDPADLPKVFDRFYRSAAARALPGSGLGLAIVAQVAESEGGTVEATTAIPPETGALFRLSFPVIADYVEATGPAVMSSMRLPNGSST